MYLLSAAGGLADDLEVAAEEQDIDVVAIFLLEVGNLGVYDVKLAVVAALDCDFHHDGREGGDGDEESSGSRLRLASFSCRRSVTPAHPSLFPSTITLSLSCHYIHMCVTNISIMTVSDSPCREPKNAQSKRVLQAREPKEVEDLRTAILLRGARETRFSWP